MHSWMDSKILLKIAETNKSAEITPENGSSSHCANVRILSIYGFWRKAEDWAKKKSTTEKGFIGLRNPKEHA